MQVREGEIFGLLGPNGSGKSTLVKILLTLVRPDAAQGTMLGQPLGARTALRKVGYLPEQARFPEYLTGWQVMELAGGLHQVPRVKQARRSKELIELVGLGPAAERRVGTYSKGMRQRLGLAQALINKPALIFLDEPTDGLDPVGRALVAEILRELRRRGVTVFLNSHLLGEAERLCDRVAILSAGQVVREGSVTDLTSEGRTYEIRVEHALPPLPGLESVVLALGGSITYEPGDDVTVMRLPTTRSQSIQPVIDELRRFGLTIDAVVPKKRSLDEFFLETVGARRPLAPINEPRTMVNIVPPPLPRPESEITFHG
jgi:ABC-2 type transport system ATP-binding protein